MIGIIAIAEDGGIGYENKLPWPKIKEDLAFFKEITLNKNIIVGYNTFKGLPPLKDRYIKVLCKNLGSKIEKFDGGEYFDISYFSVKEFIQYTKDDILCGGAKTYYGLLDFCEGCYVTEVKGVYKCDTYFDIDQSDLFRENKKLIKEIDGGHRIYYYYRWQ